MRPLTAYIGIGVIVIGMALLVLFHDSQVLSGVSNEAFAGVIASVALLIWLGGGVMGRGGLPEAARNAFLWIIVFAALMGGYAYREDISRMFSGLDPARPMAGESGEDVTIRRDVRGHFMVRGLVNNEPVTFLIDTGATRVTLPIGEAERVGIDPGSLRYSATVSTANGTVQVAPVRLSRVDIGGIVLSEVRAFVAPEGALDSSLLGMSFLSRIPGYTVRGEEMTLLAPGQG
jgi:aspartyl protease family protein